MFRHLTNLILMVDISHFIDQQLCNGSVSKLTCEVKCSVAILYIAINIVLSI